MRGYLLLIPAVLLMVSCATQQEQVAPAIPEAEAVIAAPAPTPGPPETFDYTENPTLALIPLGAVRGQANGEEFTVNTIIFEPKSDGTWEVKFCEADLDDPTEVLIDGQYIYLDLAEAPEAGKVIEKPMEFGAGFFQITLPDGTGTTSWNADNAWVLEITDWNQEPWDPDDDFFQTAGTASGRVAVCYKGYGDFENSWAAGNFDGAVIRYMGEPPWVQESEE